MTVVRQSEWENLDGFQIDFDQFLVPYRPGCFVVEELSYGLKDACQVEDKLMVCGIIWMMLVSNGLYVPPRTYACYCEPWKVEPLVSNLRFESRCGEEKEMQKLLIEAALRAGIYGSRAWSTNDGR
ncbi:MAG: hypothetical protein HQ582_27625 [Planctomycetes bacterium]|nr:hypothetical protein [Planctomycetota bacterium]